MTCAQIGAACGYLAAALNAVVFVWYGREVLVGKVDTNPITWWLWMIETAVGLTIYVARTQDRSKWAAEAVSMLGVVIIAGYLTVMAFFGHARVVFASVEIVDYGVAALAIVAFVVYNKCGPKVAIFVFQAALIAAIFPLLRATLVNPSAEPFGPWALWAVAFTLQALCAGLRWDGADTLLNPINYALTHGAVAWIVWQSAAL